MDNRPIGIMDSGIGGLTVARVLHEKYRAERIVFIGDTARNPYGERTAEEIEAFAGEMKEFLLAKNVKMILIACNTISFNVSKEYYDAAVPIVGMSSDIPIPGDTKKLGIFATAATIRSHCHKKQFKEKNPELEIVEIPIEKLAKAVEYGASKEECKKIIREAVNRYKAYDIDVAVLGCTHYPLVESSFREVLPQVRFIDPAESTVMNAMGIMKGKECLSEKQGQNEFFFTKDKEKSVDLVKKIFGKEAAVKNIVF